MPEPEFLIDECLTPFLKHIARDFGFDAKSVLEVGLSGQTDVAVFEYALALRLIVVTNNGRDFRRLAAASDWHPGLIILTPSLPRSGQMELFRRTLKHLQPLMDIEGRIVDIRLGVGGLSVFTDVQR